MYIYTHQGKGFNAVSPAADMSYLRILHTSPDAPAADIYANGNLIASSLAYKQLSDYIPVIPGNYNIQVFPEGQDINPIINTNFTVPGNSASTIAAAGYLAKVSLLPIPEIYMPNLPAGKTNDAYIRFVHLSPNAPAADITHTDGTLLFDKVSYKDFTNYLGISPGIYSLQVRPSDNSQKIVTLPDITLMPNMVYTVYAVGLAGTRPPLEAIITIDGK